MGSWDARAGEGAVGNSGVAGGCADALDVDGNVRDGESVVVAGAAGIGDRAFGAGAAGIEATGSAPKPVSESSLAAPATVSRPSTNRMA